MSKQQRLNQILDLLSEDGRVDIEAIVVALDVSPATARRDLNELADRGLVSRTHGGAVAVGSAYELPLQYKIARNSAEKKLIAAAAAELVADGAVVGLTGGTTTSEVARALGGSPALQGTPSSPGVTIVTNALNIAYEMAIRPQVKIVLTGGAARRQSFELVGPLVEPALAELVLDWTFLGADGLHPDYGATTVHDGEAMVNRALARAARKVALVVDASKMMQTRLARIVGFGELDLIITDAEPPREIRKAAEKAAAELVVAGV
ncbi:DeoR/GlpR family DNA-binding transcription regulator [Nocardioides sp. YIM 152315]|uniref:DeoR/GlpR family DNA-binding transcription regulator n=1 Tax=Nocardioides sp. YIM 152315 TaxID=3031760 RepID=UPI0023DBE715|nr:DeoR/GlpR family DNA-binding transcription regulator [Nocardioides sp. YIM 152315]